MKRDWELIRKILIKLESQGDPKCMLDAEEVKGYDVGTVSYHMDLLGQAGLIGVIDASTNEMHFIAKSMTWDGHEFLDKIRQDTMWNKIKGTLREKGIELSIDAIKFGAKMVIKNSFGVEHVD